ncbi:hypothetical protein Poli38472_004790 [Pythium oligandrum]|uniref:UVR domain-containing protein n=1 Tax=Pythium oligandrum TaxID=41045 RepID=A0A8K1CAH9_PYTOL|nr:hypothetical protein Poli38472_004790 [Pythium oligandrum]|eukprot:TMW59721.1 hypothetical protein Poli38472_004790 [Pythium oligandrum]
MFGRFFKNKEDGSKSGPPGHRGSHPGGSAAAGSGGSQEAPMGGGFFNLPPPVAKGPGSTYAAPPTGAPGASSTSSYPPHQSGGAAAAPPAAYRPSQPYGGAAPSYGNSAPAAPSGGLDMFGGMSIKASGSGPSGYSNPSPAAPTYGGYGGTAPPHQGMPDLPAAPTTGGLFSGLDLAGGSSTAPSFSADEEITRPVIERKKSNTSTASRSSGTYNYMDVANSSAGVEAPQRTSITRPAGVSKVVKKKKTKSFRPGFGRQLSDESIAALQRGDLNEEELMQQHQQAEEAEAAKPPRMATNPTDLAHLLPTVGKSGSKAGGSILGGLTVHSTTSSTASSTSGILTGLTVHDSTATSTSSSPRASVKEDPSPSDGGILSGLNVRGRAANDNDDASTSVVLPTSSRETPAPAVKEPPQPEKPAGPLTPEERLLGTLRDFHASAVNFRNNNLKQNEEENRILEHKIQLAKQLTQYEIDLRDIESQQQQACEVEDFEKADALNATINSIKHCITLTESDVRKVDSELSAFLKAKEKAFANQLRSTRGTLKELEKFREDQESERSALREEFQNYEVDETAQLQFEAERIETEMHHVSVNMNHLMEEKTEIETTIEDQCRAEVTLRDELLTEKSGVEEEIRELERQLKLKLDKKAEIEESIQKAERDIDVVRNRYSRQLKRIAEREEGIYKTKREVEDDAESLKEEKKLFTEKIQDYEARIAGFGKRVTAVKKEMRAAVLLANVLEAQESRRDQTIVRKKQQAAELSALADAAAIAEQSFVMLTKQHDELEKSLAIHRNAIASAESLIPRLEQEKKMAASQRNFKEAARISKDIKALEKDQATAEEMVEVVEMELQDLKERISKRETEFEEKKEEQKKVEKQLELNSLQELWKEAKFLRKSIRQIEKLKSEGLAAADGIDFRASALLLVQAEFDACMVQVDILEKKYDVSDPAQEEEEVEDDESDNESLDEETMGRLTDVGLQSTAADGDADGDAVNGDADASDGIAAKLAELEVLIEKATENEDYELAAKLDEKIETLKRRQQSVLALSARDPTIGSAGDVEDEDEDVEEEPVKAIETVAQTSVQVEAHNDNGHSAEEIEDELRLLQARITMLEADIERATENEDYETAASLDEEMAQLREEEDELKSLLSNASTVPARTNSTTPSLFSGLGVKTEASEQTNMFAGLQVGASEPVSEAPQPEASSADIFGGLQFSSSTESAATKVASPKAVASLRSGSVGSGPNSPRRKSSGNMFGGLQMSSNSPRPSITSQEAPVETSMFAGLSVSEVSAETEVTEAVEPADVPVESESEGYASAEEESVEQSASADSLSMFAGLAVGGESSSVTSSSMEVSQSMFDGLALGGESSSVEASQSMFDGLALGGDSSPVETSSQSMVEGLAVNSSTDIEESTTVVDGVTVETEVVTTVSEIVEATEVSVTTETTTTTTAVSDDLFGGLLVTSAPVPADSGAAQ